MKHVPIKAFGYTAAIGMTAVLLALSISPLNIPPGYDQSVFRYIGVVILKGGMPYEDVFDHKPPLIYLLNALGEPLGIWGIWLFDFIFLLIAGFSLLRLAERKKWPIPILYPALFMLLMKCYVFAQSGGHTRAFSAYFSVLLISLLWSEKRAKWFWGGVLFSAIFWIQQEQILGVLPFLIQAGIGTNTPRRKQVAAQFFIGFVFLSGPLLAWLLQKGAFAAFVDQAFLFNFTRYIPEPPDKNQLLIYKLHPLGLLIPGAILAVTSLVLSFLHKPFRASFRPIAAGIGLLMPFIAQANAFKEYYFLPLFPHLTLLAGETAAALREHFKSTKQTKTWVLYLISLFLFFPVDQTIDQMITATGSLIQHQPPIYQTYFKAEKIWPPLQQWDGKDGDIFVFNNPMLLNINCDLRVLAPTKYIYTNFLRDPRAIKEMDFSILTIIKADLQKKNTAVVLDYSKAIQLPEPVLANWNAFLNQNYKLTEKLPFGGRLWLRKQSA